jgi:hypothetical protein
MVKQEQSSQQPTENNSPLEQEPTPTFEFNVQTGQFIKDGQVIQTITDQQQKLILLLMALGDGKTSLNELTGVLSVIEKGRNIAYWSPEEQATYVNGLHQLLGEILETFDNEQVILFTSRDVGDDVLLNKELAIQPHLDLVYDSALREFSVLGKPLDLPPLAQQVLQAIFDIPGEWWSVEELEPLINLGKKSPKYKQALLTASATKINDQFIPGFYRYAKFPVETKVVEGNFFIRLNTDIIDVSLKNADKTLLV